MKLDEILSRLDGVKPSTSGYTAKCPVHDDRQNSLSVDVSEDGRRILLNCFAGCSTESVVQGLGLNMTDLFTEQSTANPQKVREQVYEYRDSDGSLLYRKTRTDFSGGTKSFGFANPDGTHSVKGIKRVPYNLPAVLSASTVYVAEGEKCADVIIEAGRVATTLDSGANSKWLPEYTGYFKGKTVIILPDNDTPGQKYAEQFLTHLPGSRVALLPGLRAKGDIFDWLQAGHTLEELDSLPLYDAFPGSCDEDPEKPQKATQAETLLKLVKDTGASFFHTDMDELYAAIPIAGHTEIWPLESKDFGTWLQGLYYKATGRAAGSEAVNQTVAVLSASAKFDNPETVSLSTRVAAHGGSFWYDLSNPRWQNVEISADGWAIRDNPPLLFSRYKHQAAQAMPQPGGEIRKLLNYIPLKAQQTLFLSWLVSCFAPGIPHPMPIFFGEKGAAKSTTCEFLKALIDPSALGTLTLQSDSRALAVNLQQHWFLPFDNVSFINGEVSDTLCRAITGSGIQQRKLFTNADDTIFTFMRCLAINGINNVATRSDLLDRSILVELERINESDRRELKEVKEAFESDRPAILGGIFDLLASAMKIYPSVKFKTRPRMADFARWGYAIAEAMEAGKGEEFLAEYAANRDSQNLEAINSDPVATLIVEFMSSREQWKGKVSDLYSELCDTASDNNINVRNKSFPSDPTRLSKRLNGIRSNLEGVGITFEKLRASGGVTVSLKCQNVATLATQLHKPSDTNALRDVAEMYVATPESPSYTPSYTKKPSVSNGYVANVASVAKIGASEGEHGSTVFKGVL